MANNHLPPPGTPDRPTPSAACPTPGGDICPLCHAAHLTGRHCKLLCPNCGYVESCEDIFPTNRYPADHQAPPRNAR